jgi:TatA/E family protein of Tat protein translocase
MAGFSPAHLLIILVIALIVIGPGKLPEVGAAIGKSLHEFQKAMGQAQELAPLQQPQAQPVQPTLPRLPAQPCYADQPGYGAPAYPIQLVYPTPADPAPAYAAPSYPGAASVQPAQFEAAAAGYQPVATEPPTGPTLP